MKPEKTLDLVSVLDPAIDKSKSKLREYISTRDTSHLVYKDGMQPTVFVARYIRSPVFNRVVEISNVDVDRWVAAFRHGIVEVRNHNGLPRYLPQGEGGAGMPAFVTEEQLDDFPPYTVQEIGQVVWNASFLGPDQSPEFGLLAPLLAHLSAAIYRDKKPPN